MPLLSFNEIRSRAIAFSREWADASREQGEAQSFWNDLLHVYGISRRRGPEAGYGRGRAPAPELTWLWNGERAGCGGVRRSDGDQ